MNTVDFTCYTFCDLSCIVRCCIRPSHPKMCVLQMIKRGCIYCVYFVYFLLLTCNTNNTSMLFFRSAWLVASDARILVQIWWNCYIFLWRLHHANHHFYDIITRHCVTIITHHFREKKTFLFQADIRDFYYIWWVFLGRKKIYEIFERWN